MTIGAALRFGTIWSRHSPPRNGKALAAAERLGFHRRHPDVRMLTRILSPYYCCHRTRELARREPTPLSSERALRAAEGLLDDVLAAVAARPRSKG